MKKISKLLFSFLMLLFAFSSYSQSVSFVGNRTSVNENVASTSVTVEARLINGNVTPSSVEVEIIAFGTATPVADFTAPATMTLSWPASSNNITRSLVFTINNDLLPENAEYFVLRFINPVNLTLPSASANHFTVFILDNDKTAPTATESIKLKYISSYSNRTTATSSAEIVAYDSASQRLFIANSLAGRLDIVNFSNPAVLTPVADISMATYGNINSVDVRNGIVAVAIENANPQQPGKVVFFDADGNYLNQVTVGAMPDMITFNHAGTKVLTANEGEPNTAYTNDPEGSVSIIDISGGVASLTQAQVSTAGFTAYNAQLNNLRAAGVRIFGPGATVAKDMEPEFITISADDTKVWVSCQENNAIAVIDIATATVTNIFPLGTKDHLVAGNALDANDQGAVVQIANWPVKGLYMPDGIASYQVLGNTYIITTNEGDAREYTGYSEIDRLSAGSYVLDPVKFPFPEVIKANLGRLNVTFASGNTDGDGDYDEIHAFGGRSITIWNSTTGQKVWDSGDQLEMIISKHPQFGSIFNASNANNTLKNRSDDKGPEPEGVTLATIYGRVYAFIALERIGGCIVYDVTDPSNPVYVDYKNNRNLASYGGDNGTEGIIYIRGSHSPSGKPYVILANEVSSTLSVYEVEVSCPTYNAAVTVNPVYTVPGQLPHTIYLGYGPQTVSLTASVDPPIDGYTGYTWSPATGNTASINVSPVVTTDYTVTIKDDFGCSVSADQLIQVIDIRDGDKNKVFICHNGHSNSVSVEAVPAHLAHGDQLGACIPATVNARTAVQDQAGNETVMLFPNPAKNTVLIAVKLKKQAVAGIVVTDASGKTVQQVQRMLGAGTNLVELNTSLLSNGFYFIRVAYNGQTTTQKLLVNH